MTALGKRIKQKTFESKSHEAVLSLIVAAVQVRNDVEKICKHYGLSHTHYNVLRILQGIAPDGHPRCEIIDRMLDPAPDVTRLIDNLEKRGLVKRARSDSDRRVTLHWITKDGSNLLDEMRPSISGVHTRLGARFSSAELDQLTELCARVYSTSCCWDSENEINDLTAARAVQASIIGSLKD